MPGARSAGSARDPEDLGGLAGSPLVASATTTRWIASRGSLAAHAGMLGWMAGLVAFVEGWAILKGGGAAISDGLLLRPHLGGFADVVVVWGLMIAIPAGLAVAALQVIVRRVGVGDTGVCLESWLGARTIPWSRVALSPLRRGRTWSGNGATLWDAAPGLLRQAFGNPAFRLSREQWRAILEHPAARPDRFPRAFRVWAGAGPP